MSTKRKRKTPGCPQCPYCDSNDITVYSGIHPIGQIFWGLGMLGAIFALAMYGALGMVAFIPPWFWLLWKTNDTICDDCGLRIR